MGSIVNRGTKDAPKWYLTFKDIDGRWHMRKSGQKKRTEAQKTLAVAEGRVANGKPAFEERKLEGTFTELADYWLENHSAVKCTSHDDNVGRMKHLRKAFGTKNLLSITAERIDELAARMSRETVVRKGGKEGEKSPRWTPNTINRVLALLRKVLNDGVRWNRIPYAPKVRLLPAPETAFEYLRREEAERLLSWTKANAPNDYPLYAAAIYAGPRMGELYGLRVADVDFQQRVITIQRSYTQPYTKSKKIRRVRMGSELAQVLKEWLLVCPRPIAVPGEPPPPALVFPMPDGTMRKREKPPLNFEDHLAAATCHPITFHDLRHTAASLMVMAGASLRFVQQQLGHSTITVTEKYAHLSPAFVASEADRVSLHVQDGLGQLISLDNGRD